MNDFFRTGVMKADDSEGGYLVPELIDVPAPGRLNALYRNLGDAMELVGMHKKGQQMYKRGTRSVNAVGYIMSKR